MKTTETTFYESSTIKRSQYNFKDKIMLVTFNSGITYQYDNVDIKIYEKFSMAKSQGKALNEHIKNTEIKATKIV